MGDEKKSFLEEFKELGFEVVTENKTNVLGRCPFHEPSESSLLVSKETGEFRCVEKGCKAFKGGWIDDYSKLLFGLPPKERPSPSVEAVIAQAEEKVQAVIKEVDEAIDVELSSAGRPENVGKKIRFRATSAGKDLNPFATPCTVKFTCSMGLRICSLCSIGQNSGKLDFTVDPKNIDILRMIEVSEDQQKTFIHKAAKVYPKCPRYTAKIDTHYTVENVRLMPEISFSSDNDAEYTIKQAYYVGHGLKTNTTYQFDAVPHPSPKDQVLTFLLHKAKSVQDTIDTFKMTPDVMEKLKIFQVKDNVELKMFEIASDLTANVTRIYQRESLIQMIDLIYHSVLQFRFQGHLLKKGWTEGLIIGDTRCGKTETVTRLIEHYRAGEISSGENCSFAGLIGGLQQTGSRWSITWGKLPLNDRRLFVIDEISGMPLEDIGKMSGVRSSGIAEITKVQSEKTFARARQLWMGNPRESRALGSYDTGVQAISSLIGRPEDIARFDIAIAVASGDVPLDVINQLKSRDVEHRYTTDLCNKLVMWAWSRKSKDVVITKEAEELCLRLASEMGKKYSSQIPLVEPSEQRVKIMRLSVACAARLFSTLTGEDLVVMPIHVQYVYELLERLYASPALNYAAYSKAKLMEKSMKNEDEVKYIITGYGPSLVDGLLNHSHFSLQDLEDLFDLGKKELKSIVAKLIKNRALRHSYSKYVKTPAFIEMLRKLQEDGVSEPPAYDSPMDKSFATQEELL